MRQSREAADLVLLRPGERQRAKSGKMARGDGASLPPVKNGADDVANCFGFPGHRNQIFVDGVTTQTTRTPARRYSNTFSSMSAYKSCVEITSTARSGATGQWPVDDGPSGNRLLAMNDASGFRTRSSSHG